MGACLDMKSSAWHSKDAPMSKFRNMGWKIEDWVGIVSADLLKFKPNASILLNSLLMVLLCSMIWQSILFSMDTISLFEIIMSIS